MASVQIRCISFQCPQQAVGRPFPGRRRRGRVGPVCKTGAFAERVRIPPAPLSSVRGIAVWSQGLCAGRRSRRHDRTWGSRSSPVQEDPHGEIGFHGLSSCSRPSMPIRWTARRAAATGGGPRRVRGRRRHVPPPRPLDRLPCTGDTPASQRLLHEPGVQRVSGRECRGRDEGHGWVT